jgi:hypothetical protein
VSLLRRTDTSREGRAIEDGEEKLDIITAYEETGSYRAAAELCGTTHETVSRVKPDL